MSQQELLTFVVGVLDRLRIDYFLTGSWSSSLLGEPRSTHDLDLVVQIGPSQTASFLAAFADPRFYLSAVAVQDAVEQRGMFNLLDLQSGDKVDFWLLTEDAWDQTRFRRRRSIDVFGVGVQTPSPEDAILAKLRWSKLCGGSEKQIQDARGILELQGPTLDWEYLVHWVTELDLADPWRQLPPPNHSQSNPKN